jgi:hypothetical protein
MVPLDTEFTMAIEAKVDDVGNQFEVESNVKGDIVAVRWVAPGPSQEQAFNRAGAKKEWRPNDAVFDIVLGNLTTAPAAPAAPAAAKPATAPKSSQDGVVNSRAELNRLATSAVKTYGSAFPSPAEVEAAKAANQPKAPAAPAAPAPSAEAGRQQVASSKEAVQKSQEYRADQADYAESAAKAKEKGLAPGAVTTRAGLAAAANLTPERAAEADAALAAQKGSPAAYTERKALTEAQKGPTPSNPSQTMDPSVEHYMKTGAVPWEEETMQYYKQAKPSAGAGR